MTDDRAVVHGPHRDVPVAHGRWCIGAEDSIDPVVLYHFLTARAALFGAHRTGLHQARAFHDPWPLLHARLVDLDDCLVAAAGLSTPEGTPLVHYAPSVEVRIGWPTRVPRGC